MTSLRQIAANRINARKSTGPRAEEGKQQSRRNALRHGLTAETVIGGVENVEDYTGFEAAIIADYDAQTAVEASSSCELPRCCGGVGARSRSRRLYLRFRLVCCGGAKPTQHLDEPRTSSPGLTVTFMSAGSWTKPASTPRVVRRLIRTRNPTRRANIPHRHSAAWPIAS
jgi:hypothetical protein